MDSIIILTPDATCSECGADTDRTPVRCATFGSDDSVWVVICETCERAALEEMLAALEPVPPFDAEVACKRCGEVTPERLVFRGACPPCVRDARETEAELARLAYAAAFGD